MSYDSLLGNGHAHSRLQGLVKRDRIAHAYLLAGVSGIGKKAAALEFAKALLCDKQDRGIGCAACASCQAVDARRHASVRIIAHATDKREILIDQVRELQRELSFRAIDDKRRIVLIDEAERLNEEAQNALLKTLEEPPDRCVIVLVSASPAMLLPTLVSRCQTLLFTPLSEEEILKFCVSKLSLDAATAGLVARLATGSPGRAAALAPHATDLMKQATELLSSVATGDLNPVIERLSKIRETEQQRERAREQLTIVAFALRELLRSRAGGAMADSRLVPPALAQRLSSLDVEDIADRIEGVLDHLHVIDLNANVGLTVEDALLRI